MEGGEDNPWHEAIERGKDRDRDNKYKINK